MPNRYVRESAIESERVNQLSWQGEVFFRRLINRVDDFGRLGANPQLLRASIFPLQIDKVSVEDVTQLIKECHDCHLLATYQGGDGKAYLVLAQWEKGRAKASRYPSPPDEIVQQMQTHVYTCLHTSADTPDSDSDSDSDTDPDSDSVPPLPPRGKKEWIPDPIQSRLNALYSRRDATPWDAKMLKAYRAISFDEEEIKLVEKFHAAPDSYKRKGLPTLLNNWGEEVDRARMHRPAKNQPVARTASRNQPVSMFTNPHK